jgi:hypothetical protein
MNKHLITAIQVIVVVGFVGLGIANIVKTSHKVKVQDIQLKSKQSDLIQLENKFDLLNKELQEKNINAEKAKQLEAEKIELQKQLEQAQKDLQAKAKSKADQQAKLAQAVPKLSQKAYAASGSCAEWMAAAGIPQTEATTKLILKESGCNPSARNPSSGAFGIPQAYPASKIAHCGTEPVCQLQWMDAYIKSRYGSWENALATWYSRCGSPQGCWY